MDFLPRFDHWYLLLLLAWPVLVLVLRLQRGGAAFGAFGLVKAVVPQSLGPGIWRALFALACALLVIAAARPQIGKEIVINDAKGRDLMLVIDLSYSMYTDDIVLPTDERVTRLTGVVEAAEDFIAGRPADRIGLVFFAEESLLGCPLTFDHRTVIQFMEEVRDQQLAVWEHATRHGGLREGTVGILGQGTNLGLGLGEALRSLLGEDSQGKALVLITDGRDSRRLPNWVDPVKGARHAKRKDVKVYAIGVGDAQGMMTNRELLVRHGYRKLEPVGRNLLPDMQRLQEIVAAGDGRLMKAEGMDDLKHIFEEIDRLEPSTHEVRTLDHFTDRFHWPLVLGSLLLACCLLFEPPMRGPW